MAAFAALGRGTPNIPQPSERRDFAVFWRAAARYPLLDRAAEQRLARQARDGDDAARRLARERDLSPAARAALLEQVEAGRSARAKFICSNLRLVASAVGRYRGRGLDPADLFQEGALGLMRAAELFDPDKGYKFSTYARWWIGKGSSRAVAEKGRTIRIPVNIFDGLRRVSGVERRLTATLGRTPTLDEVADGIEIEVGKLASMKCAGMAVWTLNGWEGHGEIVTAPPELGRWAPSAEDVAVAHEDRAELLFALADLHPRETDVLLSHYGLRGRDPETHEQIGRRYGLTRARIHQIEQAALKKLRTRLDRPSRFDPARGP